MAKTRKQKQQLFTLYQDIAQNQDFVLIRLHTKLPAKAINAFRLYLLENNGKMYVLKNKVFLKAVAQVQENVPALKDLNLEGPIGLIAAQDIIIALKGLKKLEQDAKDLLALIIDDEEFVKKYKAYDYVMGVVQKSRVNAQDLAMLSQLPGVDALYGMLAGGLKALLNGLAGALSGNIRNLAYALKQVAENK